MSFLVFCICAGCAFLSGGIEGLLFPLRKKLPLPFTVFTDIGLGMLLVAPFGAAVFFLYNGRFTFYALPFAAAFFGLGAYLVRKIVHFHAKKTKREPHEKIAKTP